jgi:hypothetical protein
MPDKISVGNFSKGKKTDRLPPFIDNDAFPTLFNMYSWRGRIKRKRGTSTLARLQRQVQSVASAPLAWQFGPLALIAGVGNLISGFALEANGSITPGSITLVVGANTYKEPAVSDGTLIGTPGGSGTINYATGVLTIVGGGVGPLTGSFSYYPDLPVLGLEDFVSNTASSKFPLTIAFDTTYAYQLNQAGTPFWYDVSYYKNTNNPFTWSNDDSAQFWSTNYQSAFWVTNNKPGLHFLNGTYTSGSGTNNITFNFKSGGVNFTTLVVGDVIFFNEWPTVASPLINIDGLNGTVLTVLGAGNYIVSFTTTPTVSATGIAFLLTNSLPGQDGIRWYDGDPTSGTGLPTETNLGWVNFSPPLTALTVGINDQTPAKYYLVGALEILPFKDRLLFFAPQIQAINGAVIQMPMQDTVIWSWNGTPYYNALVPTNASSSETFDVRAYYVDQIGFGGFLPAGISKPIITVMTNEDVLLIGFGGTGTKTRFVFTGNDLQPFLFYLINSELPSSSTFSGVTLDRGGTEIGQYGITMTTQQSCQRIDLDIPDEVFEIQALNNGQNRVNGVRDFYREWIYWAYPTGDGVASGQSWKYPCQTFMFNYRDNTWAIFRENFTHQGTFRRSTNYTWFTIPFPTWDTWQEPWDAGTTVSQFPSVIAGNPQGYVLIKDEGTGEAPSGAIAAIANDGLGFTQITSVNHCVNSQSPDQGTNGDYLSFGGKLPTTTIGKVSKVVDINNFVVDIPYSTTATITNATQAIQAILTIVFLPIADAPAHSSYFIGQQVTISGVVGMVGLNGNTYTILNITPQTTTSAATITLNVDTTGFGAYVSGGIATLAGYVGMGSYTRLSQPLLQTKQFSVYWDQGRKVRIGVQKYLLDYTSNGQVTVNINLSQDPDDNWNFGPIVPSNDVLNNSLIYSQLLYTCPESTNLGLTPANTNLQLPTADNQFQIWHRINTSLIGDNFQIGITLSDAQMHNLEFATSEIAVHQMIFDVSPSSQLV